MRLLEVGNTAIDLNEQAAPFIPNNTVLAANLSAEQRVLQGSVDEAFTAPVTLATLAAAGASGCVQSVTLAYQFVRCSTAGGDVIQLLGN